MDTMNTTTMTSGSVDDNIIYISGSSDTTLDITDYGAATSTLSIGNIDTITLDSMSYNVSTGGTLNWSANYGDYNIYNTDPNVNISSDGITMKPDTDLKIGDRSLKDFMDRVEDRLAILHPNEALEDKWEQLKDLRKQYEALEKDIIEKEKIMEILKQK
jgi:hypothetical protein